LWERSECNGLFGAWLLGDAQSPREFMPQISAQTQGQMRDGGEIFEVAARQFRQKSHDAIKRRARMGDESKAHGVLF
jgi:hypothetical protein